MQQPCTMNNQNNTKNSAAAHPQPFSINTNGAPVAETHKAVNRPASPADLVAAGDKLADVTAQLRVLYATAVKQVEAEYAATGRPYTPVTTDDKEAFAKIKKDHTTAAAAAALKKRLGWCFAGWQERGRNGDGLQYTGAVVLDIDGKREGLQYFFAGLAERLKTDPTAPEWIAVSGLSPSGYGVKLFCLTTNTDREKHEATARAMAAEFMQWVGATPTGVEVDPASYAVCYAQFLCSGWYEHPDPQPYTYNPDLDPPQPEKPKQVHTYQPHPTSAAQGNMTLFERYMELIQSTGTAIADSYEDWVKLGLGLAAEFGEAGRSYYHVISSMHYKYEANETERKYTDYVKNGKGRTGIGVFFKLCKQAGLSLKGTGRPVQAITTPKPQPAQTPEPAPVQAATTTGDLILEGLAGEYLYDTIRRTLGAEWYTQLLNTYIQAPTGRGKTYLISELAKHQKAIFAAPTRNIATQTAQGYGGGLCIGGVEEFVTAALSCTTYAAHPKLAPHIIAGDRLLVVDEAHELAAAGFMYNNTSKLINAAPNYKGLILLSATPLPTSHPAAAQLRKIVVKYPASNVKKYTRIEAPAAVDSVAAQAITAYRTGSKVAIFLNSKGERLHKLVSMLERVGKVVTFNASSDKAGEVYESITNAERLPECDFFITTSVIKTGTNIKGLERVTCIIADQLAAHDIEQFTARFRGADITCLHFAGERDPEEDKKTAKFNRDRVKWSILKVAEPTADWYNSDPAAAPDKATRRTVGRITGNTFVIQGENGTWQTCPTLIDNYLTEREMRAQMADPERMAAALNGYGWQVEEYTETATEAAPVGNFDKEAYRAQMVADAEYTIQQLQNVHTRAAELKRNLPTATDGGQHIRELYEHIEGDYNTDIALRLLQQLQAEHPDKLYKQHRCNTAAKQLEAARAYQLAAKAKQQRKALTPDQHTIHLIANTELTAAPSSELTELADKLHKTGKTRVRRTGVQVLHSVELFRPVHRTRTANGFLFTTGQHRYSDLDLTAAQAAPDPQPKAEPQAATVTGLQLCTTAHPTYIPEPVPF